MLVNAVHIVEKFFADIFVNQFNWWVILGFVAQLMFTGRFLVQWIASERAGKSVIPVWFWFFSIAGGLMLLAYALYRRDPVFILGQAFGVFVYSRNLFLVLREEKAKRTGKPAKAKRVSAKRASVKS